MVFLEGLKKPAINLGHHKCSSEQDSNQTFPEHKTRALPLHQPPLLSEYSHPPLNDESIHRYYQNTSKYLSDRSSPINRRWPMCASIGNVYKLGHVGQPFLYSVVVNSCQCSLFIVMFFSFLNKTGDITFPTTKRTGNVTIGIVKRRIAKQRRFTVPNNVD
jgi:hypothetical protein